MDGRSERSNEGGCRREGGTGGEIMRGGMKGRVREGTTGKRDGELARQYLREDEDVI